MHDSSVQERVETSRAGRIAISLLLITILGAVGIANLPDGPLQRRLARVSNPFAAATGLDQRWQMFAPYPRREALYLEARVEFADGTVTVWRPPVGDPVVGAYRDSHWRKYVEHVALEDGSPDRWPQLWKPLARWVATQVRHDGTAPTRVTLVRRVAVLLPPDGSRPGRTPFRRTAFYTLDLS